MANFIVYVRPTALAIAAVFGVAAAAHQASAGGDKQKQEQVPFEAARLIIEFNSTDEDIGVQFFLDVDSWKTVKVLNPRGQKIFDAAASANLLRQGGGTELFLESSEPTLDELSIEEFFELFPEGTYTFTGRTPDGEKLVGAARFTHNIPAGPEIVMPQLPANDECAENVPLPVVIAWNDVTTSIEDKPLDVVRYEVIVVTSPVLLTVATAGDAAQTLTRAAGGLGGDQAQIGHELAGMSEAVEVIVGEDIFDVHLEGTTVTVPAGLLKPGTEYQLEVLAIEAGGNQTITATCFVTAD